MSSDRKESSYVSLIREVTYYKSPIGWLEILVDDRNVLKLDFVSKRGAVQDCVCSLLLRKVCLELDDYFAGKRKVFTVPTSSQGTTFQQEAWEYLQTIPYGETRSYAEQAVAVANPKAVRAVANANRNNPVAIIVPCHRVIGKNGTLTGYGGGLWRKSWLLEHEKKHAGRIT